MQKNRKIRTQGTGKEENKVENIRPDTGTASGSDDLTNAGVAAQMQGEDMNAGNEVTADIPVNNTDGNTGKTDAFHNNNSTNNYAAEVDVNAGGVSLERSPGATNKGGNPSTGDTTKAAGNQKKDKKTTAKVAKEDPKKQTGKPAGATNGSGGESIAVKSTAKKTATPKPGPSLTKIYGQIVASDNSCFLEKGSVPEGQYQLQAQKGKQDFMSRITAYNEQFVTLLGEFSKKGKSDKITTFIVHNIVSHNEIARHAYNLSQGAESSEQDNWLKAENELLHQ